MQARVIDANRNFSLSGCCPHCLHDSVFLIVGAPYREVVPQSNEERHCAAMRCQGCLKYILGIARIGVHQQQVVARCEAHYPIGKPNDVAIEIPEQIARDFQEGLRCIWLDCYKAAVTMCRRAIQAACLDLGAHGRRLINQIDDLAAKYKITESLRRMAHTVRLEGNKGAHPPKGQSSATQENEEPNATNDDLEGTTQEGAEAVIAFTKEFFHHVYVMPAKLKKYAPVSQPANN